MRRLEDYVDKPEFRAHFRAAKQHNKNQLARHIAATLGLEISPQSLFDVQIKRLHEYKRQLLLALYVIVLYNRLKANPALDVAPRTFIVSGKATPGYAMAKLIIKLVNQVSEALNRDPETRGKLKLVFLPNYRVSLAEKIIPAADVSEQISTAGTEASGTGNMKLQLNGALTIGTLDGANVEILEEVGSENIFIFGLTTEEIEERRFRYDPWTIFRSDAEIRSALELIGCDFFSMLEPGIFKPILSSLLEDGDRYFVLADLRAYIEAQNRVDATFKDRDTWDRMAILNVARSGKFSSDRTVREYAEQIWRVGPCEIGALPGEEAGDRGSIFERVLR